MKSKLTLVLFSALLLSGCSLPNLLSRKNAALQISTNPKAAVYLDGEKVGETPFQSQELKSRDYDIRLDPDQEGLIEWETTVTLYPGITTVVNYDFAADRQAASGAILTLEPLADKQSVEIAIVSIPDNASIKINGQPKGFTPSQLKNIEAGEHTLLVTAPGYKQQQMQIKTVAGHKLTVDVQLANKPIEEASPSAQTEDQNVKDEQEDEQPKPTPEFTKQASPSATDVDKPYIEILDTPTGWLRVRETPTTAEDNEVAKVYPGEKYKYLETNDTGWHKIRLEAGETGWISGRYARLVK